MLTWDFLPRKPPDFPPYSLGVFVCLNARIIIKGLFLLVYWRVQCSGYCYAFSQLCLPLRVIGMTNDKTCTRARARVCFYSVSIGVLVGGAVNNKVGQSVTDKKYIFARRARMGHPTPPQHLLAVSTYFLYFWSFLYGIPDERVGSIPYGVYPGRCTAMIGSDLHPVN